MLKAWHMKAKRYAAIVLAAGFSHRMQHFKPLLPLGKETIADHLMATFLQNGVDVYLVVGYRQKELRAGISTRNIQIVENRDYQQGMFSSVQAGLRSLKSDYQAAFIAPVDIPLVHSETIRRLLKAAEEHPGKVIHPVFNQKRGHPPLIPANMFPAVLGWQGDGGLKSVPHFCDDTTVGISVPDSHILFDVDEPVDYEKLLERFQCDIAPSEAE
ncbi:NTP transferase domain-containing protein [Chloroflexota bacterium]